MIKVLVVDDHDLVRAGITRMLADDSGIKVVGQASSGEEALEQAKKLCPDIVLMDLKMPGIGGLEATKKLKRIDDGIRVIVVTACDDDVYPRRVMQAGASAYITKGADIQEIIRAIRVVQSGQRYLSPDIAQKLALQPYPSGENENPFDRLAEREMQVATMIVNCQRVQDISDQLCLSPKTVNTYRYRIFEKLEITSDVELTLLAVRHGILDAEKISKP